MIKMIYLNKMSNEDLNSFDHISNKSQIQLITLGWMQEEGNPVYPFVRPRNPLSLSIIEEGRV